MCKARKSTEVFSLRSCSHSLGSRSHSFGLRSCSHKFGKLLPQFWCCAGARISLGRCSHGFGVAKLLAYVWEGAPKSLVSFSSVCWLVRDNYQGFPAPLDSPTAFPAGVVQRSSTLFSFMGSTVNNNTSVFQEGVSIRSSFAGSLCLL